MLSKRDVLVLKYRELKEEITTHFSENVSRIFPTLGELDVGDIVFYICYAFYSEEVYYSVVKSFLDNYKISMSEGDIDNLVTIITPYISFIKNIQ